MVRKILPLSLVTGLALTACSTDPEQEAVAGDEKIVPAETARLLSLGGHMIGEDETAFELSRGCATSLRVTAAAMRGLTGRANPKEMAMIDRAAEIYENRAIANSDGTSARAIRATIARDSQRLKDERSEQAQLAIVCLRSLG